MTTTQDTPVNYVMEIPVDLIDPAPDNLRTKIVASTIVELAQSIAAQGLINPIKVMETGNGRFSIVAGHRRYEAIKSLSHPTISAIVDVTIKSLSDRMETMLVENLQRVDLDPVEEAYGYFRLVNECGVKVKDIASKVGRPAAHVSRRLSLMELPSKVTTKVSAGKIGIDDALALLKLEDPALMQKVADQVSHSSRIPDEVNRYIRARDAARSVNDLAVKLEAKGIKVFTELNADDRNRFKILHSELLLAGEDNKILDATDIARAHKADPCHAVQIVTDWNGKVAERALCTEPKNHNSNGLSKLKTIAKARNGPEGPQDAEHVRQAQLATDTLIARQQSLVSLLGRPNSFMIDVFAGVVIERFLRMGTHRKICGMLDITPTVEKPKSVDYEAALDAYIAKSTANKIRVAFGLVILQANTEYGCELLDRLLAESDHQAGPVEKEYLALKAV